MPLTRKEKAVILVSQAIMSYSMKMQDEKIPEHQSVIDFVLKSFPDDFKPELSAELIDDVFAFVLEKQLKLS